MGEAGNDEWGLLELQRAILEIACLIDDICRSNHIEYFLMGGSALGAARHGGFIPWDDDLDIFMTPSEYARFIEALAADIRSSQYHLQQWGLSHGGRITIAKLRRNGTTYIERSLRDRTIHHGIYVDIFMLHPAPDAPLLRLWQYAWARFVVALALARRGYDRRGRLVSYLLNALRSIASPRIVDFALRQVYIGTRRRSTRLYCNYLGRAGFGSGSYLQEWFSPGRDVAFETTSLRAPRNLEAFLRKRFGDYLQLPSRASIVRAQHAEEWDTSVDFRERLSTQACCDDEADLL